MASLVPNLDRHIQGGHNILLYGKHGVGKTEVLRSAAKRLGLNIKYYSCSTLDPFTDLVGIPYPVDHPVTGAKTLQMVRPHDLDDADGIFFDELNRAQDSKTLNAVFEVIQFGTINGEPLPKLKFCWAAVNPADDEEYQVQDLDPALVDRFDVYFDVKPQVSIPYLVSEGIDRKVAGALQAWYNDAQAAPNATYISPRRIHKMAMMVQGTQDVSVVKSMLPPGSKFPVGDLIDKLKIALRQSTGSLGVNGPADPRITYTSSGLRDNVNQVSMILNDPNTTNETFNKVIEVIDSRLSIPTMIELGPIIQSLPRALFEGTFNSWSTTKQSQFKASWKDAHGLGKVSEPDLFNTTPTGTVGVGPTALQGLKFVITGAITGATQGDLDNQIRASGGRIQGAVTASTSYLIVGTAPGQIKISAARHHNVKAVHVQDMLNTLANGVPIKDFVL